MKIKKLTPMLWTEQLQETIDFYTQTLPFICRDRNDEWGWAALHLCEVDIMLAKPNAQIPFDKPVFTGSFYFEVENVAEWWAQLKDQAQVCYPIETFDWGMREFAIFDNNGYILQFGEEVAEGQTH